jgi:hypothetical protein
MWICFLTAIAALATVSDKQPWAVTSIFLGVACYRLFDLAVAFISFGLLGLFRNVAALRPQSPARIQRFVLFVLMGYLEIAMWFGVVYRIVARIDPTQFANELGSTAHAYYVSFSTMSTIGYGGYAPVKGLALFVATVQSLLSMVIVVQVFSACFILLGWSQQGEKTVGEGTQTLAESQTSHPTVPVLLSITFTLLGFVGLAALAIGLTVHPNDWLLVSP